MGNCQYGDSNWSQRYQIRNINFSNHLFYGSMIGMYVLINPVMDRREIHPMNSHMRLYQKENSSTVSLLDFHSVMGRRIRVFVYGNEGPTTLVIGGIHGDEPSGVALAEELIKRLQSSSIKNLAGRIVVIPKANPDGFVAGTRVNARGIDLNRNFPTRDFKQGYFTRNCYPGAKAGSEPETRLIILMAEVFKPQLILAFHAELGCVNYDGPGVQIAKAISSENGLPVRKDLGYPTPGSLGTYFGVERNIPVITLELLNKDDQWKRHGKALLEAIKLKGVLPGKRA